MHFKEFSLLLLLFLKKERIIYSRNHLHPLRTTNDKLAIFWEKKINPQVSHTANPLSSYPKFHINSIQQLNQTDMTKNSKLQFKTHIQN